MSGKMSFSKINPILSLGSVEPNINGQAKNGRLKVDSAQAMAVAHSPEILSPNPISILS